MPGFARFAKPPPSGTNKLGAAQTTAPPEKSDRSTESSNNRRVYFAEGTKEAKVDSESFQQGLTEASHDDAFFVGFGIPEDPSFHESFGGFQDDAAFTSNTQWETLLNLT